MPELLLELFSEEIPARMQGAAEQELARLLAMHLKEAGFHIDTVRTLSTPRRLVAVIDDLPEKQPDLREEKKGPKVGAPEKAIEGFLRSIGKTSIDDVEMRDTDKGAVYFHVTERKGRPTPEVIAEIVPEILHGFHWPKSMRWGARRLRWVRPLHRIVCLFGGAVVPFSVENIQSSGEAEGHRFMGRGPYPVRSFEEYQARMRESHVVLDPEERRERIVTRARVLARDEGFELVDDEALLTEVGGLVEWPVILQGRFDEAFLELPDEVLVSVMRGHQKYFSVRDPQTGRLAPRFITVANLEAEDGGRRIITGNERVLRARLSDARFFWDQDRKTPLADNLPQLADIVFHAKLGSVADRVARIETLARELALATKAGPDQAGLAARLAKADLVSGMVYEFPELQGLMGRYYALHDGVEESVADAVRDHYAPLGPTDDAPSAPVSMAVALADKIDTLAGFWAIGEKPTGSKDPFALRRAALGVIRIVLENGVRIRLEQQFRSAIALYAQRVDLAADPDELITDILAFFADRMKVHLRGQDVRHDLIDAVFSLSGQDDLVRVVSRVDALHAFLGTDDGVNLVAGYKRAVNILRIEEKKDDTAYDGAADPTLFLQDEERALFEQIGKSGDEASALAGKEDFQGAMTCLAQLRPSVDAFFDQVTVNADDAAVRRNRLKLLSAIRSGLFSIADFSRIEG